MRLTMVFLLSTCFLAAAIPAWGQAANKSTKPGILGYLDPRTGAFRPVPLPATDDDAELPTATTVTGTVTLTITITVKSSGLNNASLVCNAEVTTIDGPTTSPTVYDENDEVTSTGTGTTRTCKLSIPYSWSLNSPSTDKMTTNYIVSVVGAANARTSSRSPLDTRIVPANGATTTLTASVTQ